jgi:chorismate synthase
MSSTYGNILKLSIFGQSHGAAIGMTLDGIPAGLAVDFEKLQIFLNRRAPGQNDWSTPRKEEDKPEFLAGVVDGKTCGAPIAAIIHNNNTSQ